MAPNPKPEKTEELPMDYFRPRSERRILLVDDDKFLLEFFGRILTAQGFQTVMAGNGSEAEELLKTPQHFDLMVVDLLMPIQSGWKLVEFVNACERHKDMPIIALTGLSLSYDEFEKIRRQTSAVLLKGDFEIARFTETINQLLRESDKKKRGPVSGENESG